MENVGLYIAMAFGSLIIVLVLIRWSKQNHIGTAESVLLFFGLIAITVSTWKTLELNFRDVRIKVGPDSPGSPNSHPLRPFSPGERDRIEPSPTPSFDISGRYSGTLTERGRFIDIILDIQSGPGGTLKGELVVRTRGLFYEVEGQVRGNKVSFEAPVPGAQARLSFEGEFTGTSIRGGYSEVNRDRKFPAGEFVVHK